MSSDSWCTGAITITPTLTWADIQGAPNVYSVELRRAEESTDSEHGRMTVVTADAIVPSKEYEYSSGSLIRDLQVLVSHFEGHAFGGHIQCDYDSGVAGPDEPNRERFIVVDGRVEAVMPVVMWPGEVQDQAPAHMSATDLAVALTEMAGLVAAHDSFDGSIQYFISERATNEYDVNAAYRTGNSRGQGGMRVIRGTDRS